MIRSCQKHPTRPTTAAFAVVTAVVVALVSIAATCTEAALSRYCKQDGTIRKIWPGEGVLPECTDENTNDDAHDDASVPVHQNTGVVRTAIRIRDASIDTTSGGGDDDEGTGMNQQNMFTDMRVDFGEPEIDNVDLTFTVKIRAPVVDPRDSSRMIPIVSVGTPSTRITRGMCTSLRSDQYDNFDSLHLTNPSNWTAPTCQKRRSNNQPVTYFDDDVLSNNVYLPLEKEHLFAKGVQLDKGNKDCDVRTVPTSSQIEESDSWYDHYVYTLSAGLNYLAETCQTPGASDDDPLIPAVKKFPKPVALSPDMLPTPTVTYEFSISYVAFTSAKSVLSDWRQYIVSVSPVGSFQFTSLSPNPAHASLIGLSAEECQKNTVGCIYNADESGRYKRMRLTYSLVYSGVSSGRSVGPQHTDNIVVDPNNCYDLTVEPDSLTSIARATDEERMQQQSIWTFTAVTDFRDTWDDATNSQGEIFMKKCNSGHSELLNQFNFAISLYKCGGGDDGVSTLRPFNSSRGSDWRGCDKLNDKQPERIASTVLYKVYRQSKKEIKYDMVGELLFNRSFPIDFDYDPYALPNVMLDTAPNSRMVVSPSMLLVNDAKTGASSATATVPMLPLKPVLACYINDTRVLNGDTPLEFLPDFFTVKEVRYTDQGDVYKPKKNGDADLFFAYKKLPDTIEPLKVQGNTFDPFDKSQIFYKPPKRLIRTDTNVASLPKACGGKNACDATAIDLTKIVQALHSVTRGKAGVYSDDAGQRIITALEFSFSCLYMLPGIDDSSFEPPTTTPTSGRRRLLGATPAPARTSSSMPTAPQTTAFQAILGSSISLIAAGGGNESFPGYLLVNVQQHMELGGHTGKGDSNDKYKHSTFWMFLYIVPSAIVVVGVILCGVQWWSDRSETKYFAVNGSVEAQVVGSSASAGGSGRGYELTQTTRAQGVDTAVHTRFGGVAHTDQSGSTAGSPSAPHI